MDKSLNHSSPDYIAERSRTAHQLERDGYATVDSVVPQGTVLRVESALAHIPDCRIGTRGLLGERWCRDVVAILRSCRQLGGLLPPLAVQCTLFRKSLSRNWLVRTHRDKSVPVAAKIDVPGWTGWSLKEGLWFVQPPFEFMSSLVAVRLNLDADTPESGALAVVPGSHRGSASNEMVDVTVGRGGVAILRPTILHKSTRLRHGQRRVLHFVFGPRELPGGLQWAFAR